MKLLEEKRQLEKLKLEPITLNRDQLADERRLRDKVFAIKDKNPEKYDQDRHKALKDKETVKYDLIDFIHQKIEDFDRAEREKEEELRR